MAPEVQHPRMQTHSVAAPSLDRMQEIPFFYVTSYMKTERVAQMLRISRKLHKLTTRALLVFSTRCLFQFPAWCRGPPLDETTASLVRFIVKYCSKASHMDLRASSVCWRPISGVDVPPLDTILQHCANLKYLAFSYSSNHTWNLPRVLAARVPHLVCLSIDAAIQSSTLRTLGQHLPHLQALHLGSHASSAHSYFTTTSLERLLAELRHLKVLMLFGRGVLMRQVAQRAPHALRELKALLLPSCFVGVQGVRALQEIGALRTKTELSLPDEFLIHGDGIALLRHCVSLRALSITSFDHDSDMFLHVFELLCTEPQVMPHLHLLGVCARNEPYMAEDGTWRKRMRERRPKCDVRVFMSRAFVGEKSERTFDFHACCTRAGVIVPSCENV